MHRTDRYGWRDPAKGEWTAGDIAFGWLVGAGVILGCSIVFGLILAGSAVTIGLVVGAMIGLPTLTLYGVPVAIGAATLLRRVPSGWGHLAVFAALGAAGGAAAIAIVGPAIAQSPVLFAPGIITGTLTAVLARALAEHRALRVRGSATASAP